MMVIAEKNAPRAFAEGIWIMRSCGEEEMTRNGPVKSIPGPVLLEVHIPDERIITYPPRNANPFFHCLEFVWMMAGEQQVKWIEQFNSRMRQFAEDTGEINGAYGYRWLEHWGNQLTAVIDKLTKDPTTRQAVLTMWDPHWDLYPAKKMDRPCNTHIYFRVHKGMLNMTVCNRSNDMMWGMFGANIVHMTMLHEFVALATGLKLGVYRVFTNNLHVYTNMEGYPDCLDGTDAEDHDIYTISCSYPLLAKTENYLEFLRDARKFVRGNFGELNTRWFNEVAKPMYDAYMDRKNKTGNGQNHVRRIRAEDWRMACAQWISRKDGQPTTPLWA